MSQLSILTVENLQSLVGKTIEWTSASAQENQKPLAVAKINSVDLSQRKPITATTIEGNSNIDHAFVEDGLVFFGDWGRHISFKIVS